MKYFILLSLISIALPSRVQLDKSKHIVGGWAPADPNGTSVQRIAKNATQTIENGESEIVKICKANTQVVAGVNYDISMIIKSKGSLDDSTNRHCKVRAYERAWEKFLEIVKLSCDKNQKDCPK